MVLVCWVFLVGFFFFPLIAFLTVLMLHGSDGKGEMNLLCCIFLHSCKAENKWKRLYIFSAGFSGFILQKCFSLFIFD